MSHEPLRHAQRSEPCVISNTLAFRILVFRFHIRRVHVIHGMEALRGRQGVDLLTENRSVVLMSRRDLDKTRRVIGPKNYIIIEAYNR